MKLRLTFITSVTALVMALGFAAIATAAMIDDDDVGHSLKGTNSADTINANGGNDTVNAKRGADTIDAGSGDDRVLAGGGADVVFGADGDDVLHGGLGADLQHGGPGNDTIFAHRGRDESWGDEGNDTLWALARGDVNGRQDRSGDILHGGDGDDTFRARDGERDVIDCGPGEDKAILDYKDVIDDATEANKKGSCEQVIRRSRAAGESKEVVNP